MVLDKTGTLTMGKMKVTDIACGPGMEATTLLRWAGALEQASEHPVAVAIAARARADVGVLPEVQSFVTRPGLGAEGVVEGHRIAIGRRAAAEEVFPSDLVEHCAAWERQGRTAVLVWCGGRGGGFHRRGGHHARVGRTGRAPAAAARSAVRPHDR